MDYLLLITVNEADYAASIEGLSEEDRLAPWLAYNQMLIDGGYWIDGGSLQPSPVTTTVRRADGKVVATTDGPYVESKEQVGGYYLVTCEDLDEALHLAGQIPAPNAAIEVRPVGHRNMH